MEQVAKSVTVDIHIPMSWGKTVIKKREEGGI